MGSESPRAEAVPLIKARQEQDGKMGWEAHWLQTGG